MVETKLWYEGVEHQRYIFTEEDIVIVLKLLDENRGRSFGEKTEKQEEIDRVFNRILIQRIK